MNKRIILVGPSCAGKTFLRQKLEKRGFHFDISYTSRTQRPEEINGVHYNFLSKKEFEEKIEKNYFYEYVQYNGDYYGTGMIEWKNSDGFIMETDGIKHINKEDRKNSFIIFLNPPLKIRTERMKKERKWNNKEIIVRILTDKNKFKDFSDYDLIISDPNF